MIALPRPLKSAIKAHLPHELNVGAAVVQLYLNDGRSTRLGLANFPSFLAPTRGEDYRYSLHPFDQDGRAMGSATVELPRYGSREVDLTSLFGDRLPAMGMIAVRIRPVRFFSLRDRHLGRIRPHFFTLFASTRMESLGLVHPQTHLGASPAPDREWVSNLGIEPATVERVELFQINPGRGPVETQAFLQDGEGRVLARSQARIPPRGTRRVEFDLAPLAGRHPVVCVGLRGLAAANGKPILFLHFRDGSFTCCHA
jgi:hypothetical protein